MEDAQAPRTIWAVSSGEYSSWNVNALFERREDADAAVAAGFGEDVQEYPLYPAGTVPTRIDYWAAAAEVTAKGSLIIENSFKGIWVRPQVEWTGRGFVLPRRPRVQLSLTHMGRTHVSVEAASQEEALKACSDAVAKLRAEAIERESLKPQPGQKPVRQP